MGSSKMCSGSYSCDAATATFNSKLTASAHCEHLGEPVSVVEHYSANEAVGRVKNAVDAVLWYFIIRVKSDSLHLVLPTFDAVGQPAAPTPY